MTHTQDAAGPAGKWRRLAAAAALIGAALVATVAPAHAEKRTLKLFNTHTHETITVTFKKNGRYIPSAIRELNRFLRDWRRNEATKMDPKLFDLVWEVYKKTGATKPIHVVSAYRSPATNNMLRSRSRGVARNSQHTQGRAMDFFIPGVSPAKLRAAGLRKEVGGVGYYPRSKTPFVHLDTGRVRHWPRMTRSQLARVFPDGKTIHIPSDGKPMPRYKQALADRNRRTTRDAEPVFARERRPRRDDKPAAVQVARAERDSDRPSQNAQQRANNQQRPANRAAFDPVSDRDDVVLSPSATTRDSDQRQQDRRETTPPSAVPETATGPTENSEPAPGVNAGEPAVPGTPPASVPEQPDTEADSETVEIATLPRTKPSRPGSEPITTPSDNALAAAAILDTEPDAAPTEQAQGEEAAFALAAADSTPALPPVSGYAGSPTSQVADVASTLRGTSDNPADYQMAALPPRTRSFVPASDPVAAASAIIPNAPGGQPQLDPADPPMLAYARAGDALDNPDDSNGRTDRQTVASIPRRPEKPASNNRRYAALSPGAAPSVRQPARAMPTIGDLRSLLDADQPFERVARYGHFGKFLMTTTTTRTRAFADLRHPEFPALAVFMEKPQRVLKRTFAEGFKSGLRTDRFTGAAIGAVSSIYTP
ncbi:MAG: DUF882 domain-containing protein [Pseudomonadota bacterium]